MHAGRAQRQIYAHYVHEHELHHCIFAKYSRMKTAGAYARVRFVVVVVAVGILVIQSADHCLEAGRRHKQIIQTRRSNAIFICQGCKKIQKHVVALAIVKKICTVYDSHACMHASYRPAPASRQEAILTTLTHPQIVFP